MKGESHQPQFGINHLFLIDNCDGSETTDQEWGKGAFHSFFELLFGTAATKYFHGFG